MHDIYSKTKILVIVYVLDYSSFKITPIDTYLFEKVLNIDETAESLVVYYQAINHMGNWLGKLLKIWGWTTQKLTRPFPGCIVNLGVIPGYTTANCCMASETKILKKKRETTNIGLDSSVGRALAH